MKSSRQLLRISSATKMAGRIATLIFALLVAGIFPAGDIHAQTVTTQPQADSAAARPDAAHRKSTVRGRVVYDDNDRPLRRVIVVIYDPGGKVGGRDRKLTSTDGNGEFVFKNVGAGKYYVTVESPGIVQPRSFDSEEDLSGVPTVSVNGMNSAEVKVRARRGGVVTGKVTYADGEPVINAWVRILRKKEGQLIPFYVAGECRNGAQTDERGVYRISGLPSGEYVVGAGERKMREYKFGEDDVGFSSAMLAATYYEGATTARSATPIKVDAGSETNDVNITLVDRSTHKISGTVVTRSNGDPVRQAQIIFRPKEGLNGEPTPPEHQMVSPDAQGQWSFDEVMDGNYTITVAPIIEDEGSGVGAGELNGHRQTPPVFLMKRRDVTVAGFDVTGLVIEVSGGGRVSGTVIVEGGKPLPPKVIVFPESVNGGRAQPAFARVRPDGTFTLDAAPTDGVWLSAISEAGNKYYTKSVTANGVDLLREPLLVKEGGEVKDVRILIAPDVATLTGRVLVAEGGAPLRGASLLLVPAEPDKQRNRRARLYGFTNVEGGFTITGAPGEYIALVLRPGSEPYSLSDETIRARAEGAPRVTLQPNERKNMDLIAPVAK
jgi:hypothetical protein